MPFIKLKTNCAVPAATADTIQKHLGLAITAIPGKTADWLSSVPVPAKPFRRTWKPACTQN